jgi:putative Holliday junction resolvase
MRILAIDVGTRRIGLALSDATGTLASPWRTLASRGSIDEDVRVLASVAADLQAQEDGLAAIVVGVPVRLDGSPNDQTPRVRRLVDALKSSVRAEVVLRDERLTSREAESRLALREKDWRKRKRKIDAAAAAIILQDYLDELAAGRRTTDAL